MTNAVVPARIGSENRASMHADKDWHTFWLKDVKESFLEFQDHFISPQTIHH